MDNSYDPSGRLKINFIRQQTMDEGSLISARVRKNKYNQLKFISISVLNKFLDKTCTETF